MISRLTPILAATAICATVLLGAASSAGASRAQPAGLSAPVIHETFTPMPCTGAPKNRTTLEQEGCAEQQILKTDKQIDALNRAIFAKLADNPARRQFIAGHRAWLSYRHAYCLSVSDIAQGGTEAGVIDAVCVAGINAQHIKDLKEFHADLPS
jgi:uncharacterized protein YecT (DUF1311 family)